MRVYMLLLGVVLAACSNPSPAVPKIEPKINPETRVAEAATRQALSSFVIDNAATCLNYSSAARPKCTTTLTFSQSNPQLAALKVGNLLVSEPSAKAPNGFLQKITSIGTVGSTVVVKGVEASIGEAIEEGEAEFQKTLSASDLKSATALAQSVRFANGLNGYTAQSGVRPMATLDFSFNEVVYDVDGNNATTNDQIRVQGSVNFDLQNGFSAGVSWKKKLGIPLYPNGIYFKVAYGVNEKANVKLSASFSKQMDKEVELVQYTFSPITVMVGPVPLVFIPTLKITVNATGQVQAQFDFSASNNLGALACFEYRDGFKNCSNFSKSFDAGAGAAAATGKARASLNGNINVLLYGLVGPYAKVGAYLELDAQVPRKPTWKLDAGVTASIGIHADLYVKTLDLDLPLLDESLGTIATAQPTPPTVTFGGGFNLGNPQLGKPYNVCASATDLQDGALAVTLTSSVEGNLGTIPAGASPSCISRTFTTEGPRTFTAKATNTSGLSDTKTASITVLDPPPDLVIYKPTTASQYTGSSLVLQGGWLDPSLTSQDCTKVRWTSSDSGDTMPANGCGNTLMTLGSSTSNRTITLTATNARGKTNSQSVSFTVQTKPAAYNAPPIGAITQPSNVLSGNGGSQIPQLSYLNIALGAWVKDDDNAGLTYTWKVAELSGATPGTAVVVTSGSVSGATALTNLSAASIANLLTLLPGQSCNRSFRLFLEVSDGQAGPPARPTVITQDFKLATCIN